MGQKHTIITADQPLYSRGNELVWANPTFPHVIFIMGGLHICFNFLKAIGKHMENAGLDDPLTEAGVYYAAHTNDTMLDGKAYYRAMRGHQLYGTSSGQCLDYGWLTMVMAMKWMTKQTLVMWPRCSRRVMAIAEQNVAKQSISCEIF